MKYGAWGRKQYPGLKPVKTDLMDWYVKRLGELRRLILEEQAKSSKKPESSAFITFRWSTSRQKYKILLAFLFGVYQRWVSFVLCTVPIA